MSQDFQYTIVKHIATLSDNKGITKELNLVSFNNAAPKFDIRGWDRRDGGEKMLKGVVLSSEEMNALLSAAAEVSAMTNSL